MPVLSRWAGDDKCSDITNICLWTSGIKPELNFSLLLHDWMVLIRDKTMTLWCQYWCRNLENRWYWYSSTIWHCILNFNIYFSVILSPPPHKESTYMVHTIQICPVVCWRLCIRLRFPWTWIEGLSGSKMEWINTIKYNIYTIESVLTKKITFSVKKKNLLKKHFFCYRILYTIYFLCYISLYCIRSVPSLVLIPNNHSHAKRLLLIFAWE